MYTINEMSLLDKLESLIETKDIEIEEKQECEHQRKIYDTETLFLTCVECGLILDKLVEHNEIEKYKNPNIVKTFIRYNGNRKYNNIRRLNKWSTWVYAENELNKMNNMIDEKRFPENIKRMAKIQLEKYYIKDKVVSRNNIRRALFVHCIRLAYEYEETEYSMNALYKTFNIKHSHYKNLKRKLKRMGLS